MKKLSLEEFVKRSREIHGNFYSYDNVKYSGSLTPVELECPIHGTFLIRPSNHINNKQGCRKCGKERHSLSVRKNRDSFLTDLSKKEGFENYSFPEIDFKNKKEKVKVICKKHGEYEAAPRDILRGRFFGCRECKAEASRSTQYEFEEAAGLAHGNIYKYGEYFRAHDSMKATCDLHGDFYVKPYTHIKGMNKCPICFRFKSKQEDEVFFFLKENGIEMETNKSFLGIKEIDLINHDFKIGIELNGLFWHSEDKKDKFYHFNKTEILEREGYRLFHIFEDEWRDKNEICKSILLNAFGKIPRKIYARECEVCQISHGEVQDFLRKNHIQGECPYSEHYCLKYRGELVTIMTFSRSRFFSEELELVRFCNRTNTIVVGGGSKLLKLVNKKIISYCDRRWFSGTGYLKMGFRFDKFTKIGYSYTKGSKRENRMKFRKSILVKNGGNPNFTEKQIMNLMGYQRIWDCGCRKFILDKSEF